MPQIAMKHNSPAILAVFCSLATLLAVPVWAEEKKAETRPAFITLDGQTRTHGNSIGPDTFIHRVETPLLHLMRTPSPSPKGAVLLFPGGGYSILAVGHEGMATAAFLNSKRWPGLLADFLRAPPASRPQANPAEAVVSQGCVDRHRQKCAAVAKEKFDLIMIGDSITHNFEKPEYQGVWNQFFAPRRALNLGYSGARTENILVEHPER